MKNSKLQKYIENRAPWKKDVDQNDRNKILWECFCGNYAMDKFLESVITIFSERIILSRLRQWSIIPITLIVYLGIKKI